VLDRIAVRMVHHRSFAAEGVRLRSDRLGIEGRDVAKKARSVRVRSFLLVFKHPAGARIYTNLLGNRAVPDVEGVAQAAAALSFSSSSSVIFPGCAFRAIALASTMLIFVRFANSCPV
jgi:hypothetical protein